MGTDFGEFYSFVFCCDRFVRRYTIQVEICDHGWSNINFYFYPVNIDR